MSGVAAESTGRRLVVDPVACDGVGLCAHLARDVVDLDRWGFPIMPGRDLTTSETRRAQRAVTGCPRRALELLGPDECLR